MSDVTRTCGRCKTCKPVSAFEDNLRTCTHCRMRLRLWKRTSRPPMFSADGKKRMCSGCGSYKLTDLFQGRKTCASCRVRRNSDLRRRHTTDDEYRKRNNQLQREYNRKIGRTTASWGDQLTTACSRCLVEFTYILGRRRRSVCDHCRKYHHEWRSFRLTGVQAEAIRAPQMCEICGSSDSGVLGKDFRIDHCHATGTIRGILCHPCNAAIGMMMDSPARLRAAADYIELRRMKGSDAPG